MKLDQKLLDPVDIDPRWLEGPFFHLKQLPAKQKGSRYEKITKAILEEFGLKTSRSKNRDHDFIYDNKKVEVKGSCITSGSEKKFSFLQIRPLQDYDIVFFTTFWFDGTVKIYSLSKDLILKFIEEGVFKKQHEGNKGKGSTYLYNGDLSLFETYLFLTVKIEK